MGASIESGPAIIFGDMTYAGATTPGVLSQPDYNPDAGPSLAYQGDGIPDVRFAPIPKDNLQLGSIYAHLNSPYIKNVDGTPQASAAANLAALANAVSGTPMVLVAASSVGVNVGVPIIPFGATSPTPVTVIGLDMGFALANCTSGSATVTLSAAILAVNYFYVGQWIAIMDVGNAAGTIPLFTQITAIGTTTITVNPKPLKTVSTTSFIANCNVPGIRMGNAVPTAVWPYTARGCSSFLNPAEAISRSVGITGVASGTGGAFLVTGYDIYGQKMTETITAGAGVSTVYGKKCFKYIASITPQFSDAHTYSARTGDSVGFVVRSDKFEDANIFWNSTFQTTATNGWFAGDLTIPATASTTDVRGRVDLGVNTNNGTGYTASPDGTKRLTLYTNVSNYNQLSATPLAPSGMFGVTQV